jgi:cytochrome c oxidase cbb3-type subunit I/II
VAVVVFAALFAISSITKAVLAFAVLLVLVVVAYFMAGRRQAEGRSWHHILEGKPLAFTFLVLFAILAGGIAELIPTLVIRQKDPMPSLAASPYRQQPYSPLELAGRDIYVREGCYNCHSQVGVPRRDAALRRSFASRRVHLYHPFQFDRSAPDPTCTGRKPYQTSAPTSHGPALDIARFQHAVVCVHEDRQVGSGRACQEAPGHEIAGRSLHGCGDRVVVGHRDESG